MFVVILLVLERKGKREKEEGDGKAKRDLSSI